MAMDCRQGYKFSDCKVRHLPMFSELSRDLSTLLDQENALGYDFNLVLSKMGFCSSEIGFLSSRYRRPTVEALKSWHGTTSELIRILRECKRKDAVDCVRRWLEKLTSSSSQGSIHRDTNVPVESDRLIPSSSEQDIKRYSFLASDCQRDPTKQLPSTDVLLSETYCPSRRKRHQLSFNIVDEVVPDQSLIRRSTEYLCSRFTASLQYLFLIPKDTTWITNSTVYINNFARLYCILIFAVNVLVSVFSYNHCPTYWTEFLISLLPVMESIYVDKHVEPYKDLIRKLIACQDKIEKMETALTRRLLHRQGHKDSPCCFNARRPCADCSTEPKTPSIDTNLNCELSCECTEIYNKLQWLKTDYESLFRRVLPKYSDLKLCVFSTLVAEASIIALLLLHSILFDTLVSLHDRLRNGFTGISYALLFTDCIYNVMIILVYYNDDTPRTVIRKDRFHHRVEEAKAESPKPRTTVKTKESPTKKKAVAVGLSETDSVPERPWLMGE